MERMSPQLHSDYRIIYIKNLLSSASSTSAGGDVDFVQVIDEKSISIGPKTVKVNEEPSCQRYPMHSYSLKPVSGFCPYVCQIDFVMS